jgi:hypothetical protein
MYNGLRTQRTKGFKMPDLRSFSSKGVDYGHGEMDRAESDWQAKQDDMRSSADVDWSPASDSTFARMSDLGSDDALIDHINDGAWEALQALIIAKPSEVMAKWKALVENVEEHIDHLYPEEEPEEGPCCSSYSCPCGG